MKVYFLNKDGKLSNSDRDEVFSLFKKGGVAVVPTDTSYGMAALISVPKAVKKVFSLKKRDKKKTSSIVVNGRSQALKYGRISCKPTKLWKAFLPGALTLVVEAKIKKLDYIRRQDGTIAIRKIDTPVVTQLLRGLPAPLTITSANLAGKEETYSLKQFEVQYKGKPKPSAFIDAGKLAQKPLSTVIKLTDKIEILRKGSISKAQIQKVLEKTKVY